jgi:hypothetical protein
MCEKQMFGVSRLSRRLPGARGSHKARFGSGVLLICRLVHTDVTIVGGGIMGK